MRRFLFIVAVCSLLLNACASVNKTVYLTSEHAIDSGFDPGVGLRVDVESPTDQTLGFALSAKGTTEQKFTANIGGTYSGSIAARYRPLSWLYAGAGWTWYGYRSTFPCESDRIELCNVTWASDQNSTFLMLGAQLEGATAELTYFPASDDSYKSRALRFSVDWRLNDTWSILLEPTMFRYTYDAPPGCRGNRCWTGGLVRSTGGSVTLGLGYSW